MQWRPLRHTCSISLDVFTAAMRESFFKSFGETELEQCLRFLLGMKEKTGTGLDESDLLCLAAH